MHIPVSYTHLDVYKRQQYCFVSSWTSEKEESIHMWNMYSNMDGVRIRLPVNPFERYTWEDPMQKGSIITSYIPKKDLYRKNMFPIIEDNILHKVNYTAVSYTHLDVYKRQVRD